MISQELASATNAANRLVELSLSHSASDVSDRIQIEEKKTQDSEDYFAMFKEQLTVKTSKPMVVDVVASTTKKPIFRNQISNGAFFWASWGLLCRL